VWGSGRKQSACVRSADGCLQLPKKKTGAIDPCQRAFWQKIIRL